MKTKAEKRRKRRKLSKLLKSTPDIKVRRTGLPPNKTFKTRRDYDRSLNKKITKEELTN